MISAVEKGIAFEKTVLDFIKSCGLNAIRTNTTNDYDPKGYKAGFDGGVDIIAEFENNLKARKSLVFYIQCKCHETPLTKQAVSEVYAGMHARKADKQNSVAVVFTTSTVSQETRQYAKSLDVELFTKYEYKTVQNIQNGMPYFYGNFGLFMRTLLYQITKDIVWLDSLPYANDTQSAITTTEEYLKHCKADFDKAQSYLDTAQELERKAEQQRQKALDIQRVAAYRSLQRDPNSFKKSAKQTDVEDG